MGEPTFGRGWDSYKGPRAAMRLLLPAICKHSRRACEKTARPDVPAPWPAPPCRGDNNLRDNYSWCMQQLLLEAGARPVKVRTEGACLRGLGHPCRGCVVHVL